MPLNATAITLERASAFKISDHPSNGSHGIQSLGGKRRLLAVVVAALALVVGPQLRADTVELLSANRYIRVFGYAGATEGFEHYSHSQMPASFFGFHGSLQGQADWTDSAPNPGGAYNSAHSRSSATQDSTLSSSQFIFNSEIKVESWQTLGSYVAFVSAEAVSFFEVSFSVSAPVAFGLSLYDSRGYIATPATYDSQFDLTSETSGSILGPPVQIAPFTDFYFGLLLPGEVYTLLVSQHFETHIPDPLGAEGRNYLAVNLDFAHVPEPSVLWSFLIGLGLLGALRWRPFSRTLGLTPMCSAVRTKRHRPSALSLRP